jgi:hypothetical protein
MEGTGEDLEFSFDGLNGTTDDFLKGLKGLNVDLGKAGKSTKALTAADLKLIATQKALAALRKFKVSDQRQKQIRSNLKQHASIL